MSEHQIPYKKPGLVLAVMAVFAIAAFALTTPGAAFETVSPVSGLMALKAIAATAMPYEEAVASPMPMLIEFYADWCTTCQAMAPTLQFVHAQFGDRLNFVMLDIDDPTWSTQIQQFRVTGVPHLAVLNSDQLLVDTFVGKVPQPVLADRVASLLGLSAAG